MITIFVTITRHAIHKKVRQFAKLHLKALTTAGVSVVVLSLVTIVTCYRIINPYKQYIVPAQTTKKVHVGLVLGAGVTKDGKPFKELKARLDSAAASLQQGTVDTLILSGDNRFKNYDEPGAMKKYLVTQKGISSKKLVTDYAGRSTYESCERAAKVFQLKQVILFSASSHLPRAIYLCRHFSIDTYGIANGQEANNSTRREALARIKAVYNVNILGERTVLGKPLPIK